MKNIEAFKEFLETAVISRRTGKRLSPKVISDVISRCQRVEKAFGIRLESELLRKSGGLDYVSGQIRANPDRLAATAARRYFYNDFVAAVRSYYRFLTGEMDLGERNWSLAPKKHRSTTKGQQ